MEHRTNLPVDYYTNPYSVKAKSENTADRLKKINDIATLAKLHLEADSVPGVDYPITDDEMNALMRRARENPHGLYDAIITAFGVGMARHDK